MSQFYFDPSRENDEHALPDAETFYACEGELWENNPHCYPPDDEPNDAGWYYWACFPGCLPDGEPMGPFETEQDALEDAREGME